MFHAGTARAGRRRRHRRRPRADGRRPRRHVRGRDRPRVRRRVARSRSTACSTAATSARRRCDSQRTSMQARSALPNGMTKSTVLILMGSDSDAPVMQAAVDMLDDARHHVRDDRRLGAPLAGARDAPGARGARARRQGVHRRRRRRRAPRRRRRRAHHLPVIGVPIDSSALKGLDALLSTVQMPPGVPVATVSIGKPGRDQRRRARGADPWRRRSRRCGAARGLQEEAGGQGRAGRREAARRRCATGSRSVASRSSRA